MKLSTPLALKQSHVQFFKVSNRFLSGLKQFGKQLIQLIAGTHEVQILQVNDRAGNVYWRVYDPVTKHSTSFGSSGEVRVWLEQRYYR